MNILILSWRGPGHPNYGGAEQATMELAKYWSRKSNVYWFTSSYTNSLSQETVNGINIIRKGKQTFGVHLAAFTWYMFAKHPKFDIVIDQFHGIPFFTPLFVRVKKVAYIHEVAREVWGMNPWPKPINLLPTYLGKYLEPLMFKYLYSSIHFLTVSNSTRQDLMEWGISSKNISVVHNGVSMTVSAPNLVKNKKTLMYLGAISRDKGILDALRLVEELNKSSNGWTLWVAGKSDKNFNEYLKMSGIGDFACTNVKYWGYVSEPKKRKLLSKAWLLVNTSVREGWGLVNIEANAHGTPVVAYDVPGCRDSVINNKTGLIIKKMDVSSMTKKILSLDADNAKYKHLQNGALSWSKKFSWKEAGKKSYQVITKNI